LKKTSTATETDEGPERFENLYTAIKNRWIAQLKSKGVGSDESFMISNEAWGIIRESLEGASAVLEFGSGLSTWLIQTQDINHHIALESSPTWFDAVIDSPFAQDADIRLKELKRHNQNEDPTYRFSTTNMDIRFDLLLIDGPVGEVGRSGALLMLELMASSGTVIVDDTHRKAEAELVIKITKQLKRWEIDSQVKTHDLGSKKMTIIQLLRSNSDGGIQ